MDCGSLLPLSGGQPAGRRAFQGGATPQRSRVCASGEAASVTRRLRRQQAAFEKRQQAAAVHMAEHDSGGCRCFTPFPDEARFLHLPRLLMHGKLRRVAVSARKGQRERVSEKGSARKGQESIHDRRELTVKN